MSQACGCPRMFSCDLVWTNSKDHCRIQCTDAELQFKAVARSLGVIRQSSLMSCSAFSAFMCVAADTGLPDHGLSQLLVSPDLKCFSHLYTFLSFMASTLYSLHILISLFTAWTLTLQNFFPYIAVRIDVYSYVPYNVQFTGTQTTALETLESWEDMHAESWKYLTMNTWRRFFFSYKC